MPSARIQDLEVNYTLTGRADAPTLVFSNSLGANLSMWDPQMPELEKQFRVLRCDTRGEGKSSVTTGPYTIDQLAGDVLRLMDHLGHRARELLRALDGRNDRNVDRVERGKTLEQSSALQYCRENRHCGNVERANRECPQGRNGSRFRCRMRTMVHARVSRELA